MGEIGASRKEAAFPSSGQLTQYDNYPDDGFYKKGKKPQFVVLSTGRFAGTTSITLNAKTDIHSNNCVYNRRDKKTWSRYVVASVGQNSDGKLPWETNINGEGIYAYVAATNLAKLAGYDDWRIPYDLELATLRDMEQPTAAPDAVAFPGWPTTNYFWSSTTLPGSVAHAMMVIFAYGYVTYDAKSVSYFVALVRGG
jgi:hypothetical protein